MCIRDRTGLFVTGLVPAFAARRLHAHPGRQRLYVDHLGVVVDALAVFVLLVVVRVVNIRRMILRTDRGTCQSETCGDQAHQYLVADRHIASVCGPEPMTRSHEDSNLGGTL